MDNPGIPVKKTRRPVPSHDEIARTVQMLQALREGVMNGAGDDIITYIKKPSKQDGVKLDKKPKVESVHSWPGEHPLSNYVVLQTVFEFLGKEEILRCRGVCKIWDQSVKYLFEKRRNLYIRLVQMRKYADRYPFTVPSHQEVITTGEFVTFLQKQDMRKKAMRRSLFNFAHFDFRDQKLLSYPDSDQSILLRNYGDMVSKMTIVICELKLLHNIFQQCPNLKYLKIFVEILPDRALKRIPLWLQERTIEDRTLHQKPERKKMVIMYDLKELDLTFNTRFKFGYYFGKRAPNLQHFKCSSVKSKSLTAPDFSHFVDQVGQLQTQKLISLEFDCFKDFCKDGIADGYAKLLEMDWSSLNSVRLPSMSVNEGKIIPDNFWKFVEHRKKSLTTLDFGDAYWSSGFYNGYAIPEFPNVTKVTIPHCVITRSDVFQKFPKLNSLAISYNSWDLEPHIENTLSTEMRKKSEEFWNRKKCGFFKGNAYMWREREQGTYWLPHKYVKNLELAVSNVNQIPKTLFRMFPNLNMLTMEFGPDGFSQLVNVMTIIQNTQLTILKIRCTKGIVEPEPAQPTNNDDDNDNDRLRNRRRPMPPTLKFPVKLAFTLIGIPEISFDAAHVELTSHFKLKRNHLDRFMTELSLRRMRNLRKFHLVDVPKKSLDHVSMVLTVNCFEEMDFLKEHVVKKVDGGPFDDVVHPLHLLDYDPFELQ